MPHRRSEYYAGAFSRIARGSRRGRGLRRTRTPARIGEREGKPKLRPAGRRPPGGGCPPPRARGPPGKGFPPPRSGGAPFSIASGLVLLGIAAFWLLPRDAGALLAATVTVLVTASLLPHLAFRPNPLAWIAPTRASSDVR